MDVLALPLPGNGKIGKRNRCSSVARNDALSASVARGSAQKPILDADPIGISARGGGEGGGNISKPWTISTNQVRVYKYKRRNGNELLRSMINVSQRDIVIARGTGLGT